MGNPVSKIKNEIEKAQNDAEEEKRMQDRLQSLQVILRAKESEFKEQLLRDKTTDKTLPVDTIVAQKSIMQIDCSSTMSESLNKALADMFGGSFMEGLKGIALTALQAVLGSSQAGEKTVRDMTTIMLYNAIVRVDYFVYSYTFSNKGAKDFCMNGVISVSTIGIVPLERVSVDVLAYLLGSAADSGGRFLADRQKDVESQIAWLGRLRKDAETMEPKTFNGVASEVLGNITGGYRSQLTQTEIDDLGLRGQYDEFKAMDNDEEAKKALNYRILDVYSRLLGEEQTKLKDSVTQVASEQMKMLDEMEKVYERANRVKSSIVQMPSKYNSAD